MLDRLCTPSYHNLNSVMCVPTCWPSMSSTCSSQTNATTMSYDIHIHDSCLQNELLNIRNVIQVTKNNLSTLRAKFSELRDPPLLFVSEQQELSYKLQELRQKELQISKELQLSQQLQLGQQLNEARKAEKSAAAKIIRAHLPNKQRTSVPVKPGKMILKWLIIWRLF